MDRISKFSRYRFFHSCLSSRCRVPYCFAVVAHTIDLVLFLYRSVLFFSLAILDYWRTMHDDPIYLLLHFLAAFSLAIVL